MDTDRRRQRSQIPNDALRHLLEACRARGQFEAMVIADEHGFLVGASDAAPVDPRALASEVPLATRASTLTRVPFWFRDQLLYVAGLGAGSAAALIDAVFGARRILAS